MAAAYPADGAVWRETFPAGKGPGSTEPPTLIVTLPALSCEHTPNITPLPAPDHACLAGLRTDQLRRGGEIDFLVFDCAKPNDPGERVPLFFGGSPIETIKAREIGSDNADVMMVAADVNHYGYTREQLEAEWVS